MTISARVAPTERQTIDESAAHPNAGKRVMYRSGGSNQSQMPGIIIGQRASIVDLNIFSYHGAIVQEGCRLIDEPASDVDADGENSCWLIEP